MNKVITISREYGAGGHSIGQRVAKELGIPFYDKDILKETIADTGFEQQLVEKEQEDRSVTTNILKNISAFSSSYYHDSQDAIHEIQSLVILKFAKQGPCVILGRCADVVLKEADIECLNIFVHADNVHRAVRVSEMLHTTDATEIQKLMKSKDASRHNYYKHYTGNTWGDSHNYDLTLDSGKLGYDTCVKLIVEAAK